MNPFADDGKSKRNINDRVDRILREDSGFAVIEMYKMIRTNLLFTIPKSNCSKIIISSSGPGEGKSINCCNLAITMAQNNARVLIMDCDLRKPSIHRLLKKRGVPGLSELLVGMNTLEECIQPSGYQNLDVLVSGTVPPNPAELLGSEFIEEVLESLSHKYEYILMDTPPINLVTDALVLSPRADGVVLVVRQNRTTHSDLRQALSGLNFGMAKVLGIILNDVEEGGRVGYHQKYGYDKYIKNERRRGLLFFLHG